MSSSLKKVEKGSGSYRHLEAPKKPWGPKYGSYLYSVICVPKMSVSENSHFKFENVRLQHLRPDHVQLTLLNWDNESVLLIWLQLG